MCGMKASSKDNLFTMELNQGKEFENNERKWIENRIQLSEMNKLKLKSL